MTAGGYFTVTGQHLAGTPTTIEDRWKEFSAYYVELFPAQDTRRERPEERSRARVHNTSRARLRQSALANADVGPDDDALIERMRSARNGEKFAGLWTDDLCDYRDDDSSADLALCRLLAFWTHRDAERMDRLFRRSGLMRLKWDDVHDAEGRTHGERTIAKAIEDQVDVYVSSRGKRADLRFELNYLWQCQTETAHQRKKLQGLLQEQVHEHVRAHLDARNDGFLVVTTPPGSGKSTAVAQLGMRLDPAYVTERLDLASSIPGLDTFHHIQPPTAENCPWHTEHAELAKNGFNTYGWHLQHHCAYSLQFGQPGSTLSMIEHLSTHHPARHPDGLIIDELNLPKWLPEFQFAADQMIAVRFAVQRDTDEDRLLWALDRTMRQVKCEAGTSHYPPACHGPTLCDRLDQSCDGQLSEIVQRLGQRPEYQTSRRSITPEVLADPDQQAPHVLGHLVPALLQEMGIWQAGGEWNSSVRVARVPVQGGKKRAWVLGIPHLAVSTRPISEYCAGLEAKLTQGRRIQRL